MEGIKIIDDWYVTVETNPVNYIVRKGKGERTAKGAYIDRARGYFTSLQGAVKFVRGQMVAEGLENASTTLGDALTHIKNIDARFENLMERITA